MSASTCPQCFASASDEVRCVANVILKNNAALVLLNGTVGGKETDAVGKLMILCSLNFPQKNKNYFQTIN